MCDVRSDRRSDRGANGCTHCCANKFADTSTNTDTHLITDSESIGIADCRPFGYTYGSTVWNAHRDPDPLTHVSADRISHRDTICNTDRRSYCSTNGCTHHTPNSRPYGATNNLTDARTFCCPFGNANGGSICDAYRNPDYSPDPLARVSADRTSHCRAICNANRCSYCSTNGSAYGLSDVRAFYITHHGAFREAYAYAHGNSDRLSDARSHERTYCVTIEQTDCASYCRSYGRFLPGRRLERRGD